ncbi:TetR/AcrR family transcriptional regulator [Paraburkholderia terrae]|uniref:TetR/AcrR family transcriptional regulator n=1 Tax=Paraburkholderia terrae TaxID=311230 RepID=A0A2I8F204_9BURK|nr:TetR/AcrR family transcriptional regulator [Paraburkholderia terrae]AUT65024.1 TetR/AcrR family transcriptional regulator [Paraburkholderia terrae]
MKKSRVETAETRRKIVEVATRAFRTNGIHATGVAEIMSAAGMTHGGFYRHFASKDQLVAEACAAGMEAIVESAEAAAEGGEEAFLKHIQTFLSDETRDDCLAGCPLVAMGSELARADLETRRAASQGFRELIDVIARQGGASDTASATGDAMFTLSAIIGAVTMSRIVDDPELSDLILDETRKRLTALGVEPRETSLG